MVTFFEGKSLETAGWKREGMRIGLWISLNLADLIVTIITMEVMGGVFIEGNPIAAWIGENIAGLAVYKVILTLTAIVLLSRIRQLKVLQWLNIVMAAVVGWNLALLCVS